jgi:hypothetical protein
MQYNHNTLATKLPAALAAALAILALAACSKEASNPITPKTTQPTATGEAPAHGAIEKLNTAKSAGKILFAASQKTGGQHDIYEKDLHTGKVTNLTESDTDELNPQLSPDGKEAVYAGANEKGNYQIFRIDLGTRKIKQLTNHDANDFDPTYTPSGDILYKSNAADGYGDIWKMNGDGKKQFNLTPGMSRTEEWKPTAVGGNLVVFTSRHADDGSMSKRELAATDELMLLDTSKKGAEPKRLTNNEWPDWYSEADPTRPGVIAFTSKEAAGGPDTIYEMNVTQADPNKHRKQLTDPKKLPGDSSDCSWAQDGTLLFANNADGNYAAMALTPNSDYYMLEQTAGDVLSPIAAGSIKVG